MNNMDIMEKIGNKRDQMINDLIKLCSIPAVNPRCNGNGEYERMTWLMKLLDGYSIPYEVFEVEDKGVKQGKRLNVLVKFAGTEKTENTLWFISHMDTVAAGDLKAWDMDPFNPLIRNGKIYGRGTEDNGQAVICSIYTCLIIKEKNIIPKCNVGFVFVSDEETGSDFGLKALVEKDIFKQGDEAIVPDGGNSEGSFIEVAEKSMVWLKFTVIGKEGHAAMPQFGINASSISARLCVELEDTLKSKFSDRDVLFDPPYSTFEVTQKFANVDSPNVLPGKDCFAIDMRILPEYKVDEVLQEVNRVISKYEYNHKVKVNYEFLQRVDAPKPTSADSRIVKNLAETISELGVNPKVGGIGGGTCAAILRAIGIPAVVWATVDDLAHQPNEYAVIDNMVRDTKVFVLTVLKYI